MMPRCYILIGVLVIFTSMVTINAAAEADAEESAEADDEISERTIRIMKVAKIIKGLFVDSRPDCLPRAVVLCSNNIDALEAGTCGLNFLRQNRNTCLNQQTNVVNIG